MILRQTTSVRDGSWIAILLLALVALLPIGRASAAEITYQSVTGIWHDPVDNVPGSQPGDPVITNGTPTSSISWGTTTGAQSGYDFTGSVPPPLQLPGPIPFFSLGSFTHRNNPVDDPSLTSVQLDVVLMLSVDGVPTGPLTFTFTFNHEETPNNLDPCPYPTPPNEGCTDRVTIVASPQPTTFQVDGVDYTLAMNFLVNGQPTNEYITREGSSSNSSGLVGEFVLPPGTPALTVDKSGPATMNPAEWGNFLIDVQNAGNISAFNVTLVDRLPDGPTGGMCDTTPEVLSARVFAADGVTPVAGKGPLVQGTDYALVYDGATCELRLNTLTAASAIGVGERLRIAYRTQLDSGTQYNIPLTNVAGATQWYNAPATNGGRTGYTRTLTDGTVGITDHEDAHTVTIVPRFFAEKSAALQVDSTSPGIVDPGDVMRYTIRIYNNGQLPITQAMLRDAVPANTTYVADSMTLNGQPVGRPDGGVSPLVAGIDVSSSDLTPPLPGAGQGTLTPGGQSAVVQFDLRVNDGVPPGTVIMNQAVVDTAELPDLLTDGDGNPATGPEPTVVVVGNLQELRITKNVSVVGGGAALAGATLEYVVQVTNVGILPAQAVVIRDDIAVPMPGYLSFVDQSWTLNAATNGITVVGSLLTADYSTNYGALQPGRTITLRFRAVLNASLAIGTRVTNTATVYWNDPVRQASATVAIDVGGMVGVGILSGTVWHDANFNETLEANERLFEDWLVELYRNDVVVQTARTDANGAYRIAGIAPNYATADRYELRFTAPNAGATTAKLGRTHSIFTNDLQRITDIIINPGSNYVNVDLPLAPNGVIYNTITRTPIPGAMVSMRDAGGAVLPSGCFYDPAQQNQVTLDYGYYRFDLSFADPSCPSGGDYFVEVSAPATGYITGPSEIIPPASSAATAAFSVPSCPATADDAIPATAGHCEVQPSELAPQPAVRPRMPGTRYHLHMSFDDSRVPGSSQIFNNHIPIDPDMQGLLSMTKTTPLLNVTRGQLVPYTITYRNVTDVPLFDVRIIDRLPPGFSYVKGSARIDEVPAEPTLVGRELLWNDLAVDAQARHTMQLLLAVGAGVGEGEFINRTQSIHQLTGRVLSNEASATVRVVPDATFDCTDVTGKVFDDVNRNGYQDSGEHGLSGVRVVSARGLTAITDGYGRFHITCAVTPREDRGSNFVLKLDDRTLPSGYRASTQPVRVERATRGKALRFNFGASIHRVVGLDLSDAVFEPGTTQMRGHWKPRLDLLIEQLQKGPAVLRLSYLADIENEALVQRRLATVKEEIVHRWKALNCCYALTVEPEVFWRLGAPPQQTGKRESPPNDGEALSAVQGNAR